MAHDSRCENADTPPSDCSCECGGSKHGNGFAEQQVHELETDIPEIERLKQLTPDEYFGEGSGGPELIEKAYRKLERLDDEAAQSYDESVRQDTSVEDVEAAEEQLSEKLEQNARDRERLSDIVEACDNREGADNWSFVDREYDGFNIDAVWENNDNGEAVTVNEDHSGSSTVYGVEYPGLSGSKEFKDENIARLHARNWMKENPEGNDEGAAVIDELNKGNMD